MIVYHYTNEEAYKSMKGKGIDGYKTDYDDFSGLIPSRRFTPLGRANSIDEKAYDGIIEGLLEPEPKSWTNNLEFTTLWYYLMHDICRKSKVILLSFELKKEDDAYVADRAHVERELYRKSKGKGEPNIDTFNKAYNKYFNSRMPALEYNRNYDVPQLAIWSPIEFERLRIEWVRPTREVWKKVLDTMPSEKIKS